MQKLTFIGLGVMGYPMAGHLSRAGYEVTVYNRTAQKAQRWVETYGGRHESRLADAVGDADAVFTCVGADPDLLELYQDSRGILANAPEGALLVDHTTASAGVAERLAEEAGERGQGFIDAPVSGGEQGAINGRLTIMCGASKADFSRAVPLLECYGRAVTRMGEPGAGQLTKMVNQITIAGLIQSLAEGIHFAGQAGLDVNRVIEVISQGAAQSWQMDNRAATMIDGHYDHGFAVDWMRKDLAICLEEARRHGASLPVAALVDQFYADVQALGGGRWDTSSLLERLRRKPD